MSSVDLAVVAAFIVGVGVFVAGAVALWLARRWACPTRGCSGTLHGGHELCWRCRNEQRFDWANERGSSDGLLLVAVALSFICASIALIVLAVDDDEPAHTPAPQSTPVEAELELAAPSVDVITRSGGVAPLIVDDATTAPRVPLEVSYSHGTDPAAPVFRVRVVDARLSSVVVDGLAVPAIGALVRVEWHGPHEFRPGYALGWSIDGNEAVLPERWVSEHYDGFSDGLEPMSAGDVDLVRFAVPIDVDEFLELDDPLLDLDLLASTIVARFEVDVTMPADMYLPRGVGVTA